ncbi:GNAT family N-acetyltransferase [Solwaraspora sp. WMMB335]|uniref:GNAT family N-acetyltransferase n=1 Tax=Solwaraspora sp. WMMB335 TaxID=3404118 RepID=UPI003B92496B
MTPLLTVRTAALADITGMTEMESGPETARYLGRIGRAYHERAMADPDQEQIVAEVGDTLVGFVVLAGLRNPDRQVELRRIVVAHSHRGTGQGRALFRAAVSRAYHQHNACQVWLDVKPDNAKGRALYDSEGFVLDGTIPDPMDETGVLLLMRHIPGKYVSRLD